MLTQNKILTPCLQSKKELSLRTLSIVFGVPVVIGMVYLGSPFIDSLVLMLLVGMLCEWSRLNTKISFHPLCLLMFMQTWLFYYMPSIPLSAHGVTMLILLTAGFAFSHLSWLRYILFVAGAVYITLATLILLALSEQKFLIIWLLSIVWATDVGAYLFGSLLKGPKLAPRLSPHKTWAGFMGGILAALCVGWSLQKKMGSYFQPPFSPLGLILILSVAAHLGDLLESMFKRYFGVKDTGHIIPGHGGLLDRLDSLLLVAIVYGIILVFAKL